MLATRKSLLLTYEYDITLQTNAFIASDELVSASHLESTLRAHVVRSDGEQTKADDEQARTQGGFEGVRSNPPFPF